MMTYTMARGLARGEKFDVKGLCEFTRQLSLDSIDWVTTYDYDPQEVRRITEDYGLKNICYTFQCDLNFPTPAERAPGREGFKRGVETALILGADKIMLPVKGKSGLSREQSFRNVVSGLQEVIGFAENLGVVVTVEHFPLPTSPFITSADVNRAVEEVPGLRITYDNGNVTTGGESAADGFRRSAKYIVHSHFKDFAICPEDAPGARVYLDGKYRRPVLVGDGDVDHMEALKAMKKWGYAGYINFEYEGSEYTPREATIEGVRRMREMMASLNSSDL
jgi:sugar phosphate isomerase/epimerase